MNQARTSPCVLAIGGLDPGGGAGLFADARAIHAAGAFACGVATLLTIQSTSGLRRVIPVASGDVLAQANEVLGHQNVAALKVGALGDASIARAVRKLLRSHPEMPAVIDTPMLPSLGKNALLRGEAVRALLALVPSATVLTVNAPEAEALAGLAVSNLDEAEAAAHCLRAHGAKAVLVKGGHLAGARAVDVLALEGQTVRLAHRRLEVGKVHGTGCALASLIAGHLATHLAGRLADEAAIQSAVRWAKARLHRELGRAEHVGGAQRVLSF